MFQFYQSQSKQSKKFRIIEDFLKKDTGILEQVKKDFCSKKGKFCGAKGMTIEQVVRVGILKQMTQMGYLKLYDSLNDNLCYRNFTKIYDGKVPKANTLCENIKRIKPQSWEKINRSIIKLAKETGIENGRKARIDATAVESNIHHPSDGTLLWDCIRVINRIMEAVREEYPQISFDYSNHARSAKRRRYKIVNTSRKEHQRRAYGELLKISVAVKGYGQSCIDALSKEEVAQEPEAQIYREELMHYLAALGKIQEQTRRRVIEEENVPAGEKLVSIFEEHTDILTKGKRNVVFGHKILLSGGKSNLVLDCKIDRGNWSDSETFSKGLERLEDIYGEMPQEVSSDGGFASKKNYEYAKAQGIEKVVFTKRATAKIKELIRSSRAYKRLKRFRAGIEGCISACKRAYGLARCTWRGWESFQSYVWVSIIAFNLNIIAEKLL